jgi:hypothetical protein
MASKIVLMNALYDQFFSFLNELIEIYPDDVDFSIFLSTLKMLKTTNPSLLPNYIVEYTTQFNDQILNGDERFFIDYSFEEYSEHVDLNIFSKLKKYFKEMNEKSKQNVWKYTQNIVKLSIAINQLK